MTVTSGSALEITWRKVQTKTSFLVITQKHTTPSNCLHNLLSLALYEIDESALLLRHIPQAIQINVA